MIAVDASIIAKWYLPEAETEMAEALAVDELIAPDIIRIEVAAAITRRVRNGKMEADNARLLCDKWITQLHSNALLLIPSKELLEEAIAFSLRLKHPLQDCLYLAAAALHRAPLITADRLFHQRAQSSNIEVRLLGGAAP